MKNELTDILASTITNGQLSTGSMSESSIVHLKRFTIVYLYQLGYDRLKKIFIRGSGGMLPLEILRKLGLPWTAYRAFSRWRMRM